jgi:hypothetical protein
MVFAPKLEGGVAYNQPVQQPNAMSAIADLFNFGVKTLDKSSSNTPKPTEDEKFGASVREFEANNSIGGTADWNNNLMRKFIFQYPEHDPAKIKGYAGGIGVQTETPIEVARDAAVEWFKTPEGMMAVAATEGMEPEERDAELARRVAIVKQQEAELAKLQRETAILEAEGTRDAKRWDVLKPTSKDMVDDTVSTILAPIFQEVSNGVAVEIPEELKQQLGIRYDTVDMNNINAVLVDTKNYLTKQARGSYTNNFGDDLLPSEDWNKEVFASIDNLIEIGKAFDSPQERTSAMESVIKLEALKTMDKGGVAVTLEILKHIPPESAAGLLELPALYGPLVSILAPRGTLLGTKEIATEATKLSTKEAGDVANDTIQIIDKGITPEFFTAFKESAKRSGYNVVDSNSFKSIISNNIDEIKRLSASNPEFRAEMSDFLNSDIQQTISIITSNLSTKNFTLVFDGKKFAIDMAGDPEARLEEYNKGRKYPRSMPTPEEIAATANLPTGMTLDTLNEKIGALGLLGDVGKEVQEAIGILNQPEKTATRETTARGKGRGRGKVVPQDVIGGLQGRGIPTHIAEGFAMNIQDESAFNTSVNEANPTVPGSRGGFGLIQWTGPRRKGLEAFAEAQGKPADDLDVQLDFLVQELGGTESAAWARISAASTKEEAAALILNEFLRPAESHRASREAKYLGGAGGFEARSGTTGEPSGEAPVLSLDSGASEVPQGRDGASTARPARLEGNLISFDSPEVQQLVAQSQTNPEETVKAAKELLAGKPMDPQVKALIEALVRIGERA